MSMAGSGGQNGAKSDPSRVARGACMAVVMHRHAVGRRGNLGQILDLDWLFGRGSATALATHGLRGTGRVMIGSDQLPGRLYLMPVMACGNFDRQDRQFTTFFR